MFPLSVTDADVRLQRRREVLRNAATARPARAGGVLRRLLAATVARLAALPHDSRDGLRSKEQDLAALGVRWSADAADDALLAREIEAARWRRRADAAIPSVHATTGSAATAAAVPRAATIPALA